MIRTNNYSLSTTTPTLLTIEDNIQSANTFVIQNPNDTGIAYLGNSSVTTSNYGFALFPRQSFSIELSAYEKMYAVSDTADLLIVTMVIERAI